MTSVMKNLPALPYGIGSYQKLRQGGFVYVDKTRFIERLEAQKILYPFIVRPRRFGKTLFTSMLDAYYDKAAASEFESNFAGTYIASHKTREQGGYYVLHLNLAGITADLLASDFNANLRKGFKSFLQRYPLPGGEELLKAEPASPAQYLIQFFNLLPAEMNGRLYVTIDEYDQAANNILARDPEKFREITRTDGVIKTFYTALKTAAEDDNIVARVFITGVTKISLDSMTSGFSIATDISGYKEFADLFGFTEAELRVLIRQSIDFDYCEMTEDEIFGRMKDYFNGYRFSRETDASVFNSSMCLYYLRSLQRSGREPDPMLDPAVDPDASKIADILSLGDGAFAQDTVKEIIAGKSVRVGDFTSVLNLNSKPRLTQDDVLKLLYFLGFLTIAPRQDSELQCPNKAVRVQFFKYYFEQIEHCPSLSMSDVRAAVRDMHQGDLKTLLEVVSKYLTSGTGLHAFAHFDESCIQTAIHMAVNMTTDYRSETEREALGIGNADILLRPVRVAAGIPSYLLELKYLKKSKSSEVQIQAALDKAEDQLKKYVLDQPASALHHLKRCAVVFCGTRLAGLRVIV